MYIEQVQQRKHAELIRSKWQNRPGATAPLVKAALGTSDASTRLRTLFGDCTEPDILSIIQHDIYGIMNVIPAIPSTQTAYTFGYIVGFGINQEDADEPDTPCDDGPSGVWSECEYTFTGFGRIQRDSVTIELTEAMMRADACDDDFFLLNSLQPEVFNPGGEFSDKLTSVLNVVAESETSMIGLLLQQQAMDNLWNGNPANNNGTGYLEEPGFDMLIDEGLVQDCPDLDSYLYDMDHLCVSDPAVWDQVKAMERELWVRGKRSRLMPGTVLCMREELFWEWTEYLPCQMAVEGCRVTDGDGEHIILDARNEIAVRQQMRDSQTLIVNGRAYPVMLDDGIAEGVGTTCANSSTIYMLNLTILNGFPTTYVHHKDYRKLTVPLGAREAEMRPWIPCWSNEGQLLWRQQFDRSCIKFDGTVEFRPIIRCPQLCGKITNVEYDA